MYTIIVGAGLWNDSVVVVLTQVFSELLCPAVGPKVMDEETGKEVCVNPVDEAWQLKTLYFVPLHFLWISVKALSVGLLFGILSGLVTKYFRFITRSPIQETFFMMLMSLISYYVGEELKASGVTSLIVTAVLQAQYAWYNLSP